MTSTSMKASWSPLLLSLIVAAVALVYWPGLNGGFVFDDAPNIVNNTDLHVTTTRWADWMTAMFSSPSSSLQRPLAMLSFAINHYFTGLDPWPMKLTNVAIHGLNTILVFFLAHALTGALDRRLPVEETKRTWVPAFVAAAWALHPINLMAVLFVVQRMESLCHTFVFAGLLLYLTGRQRQQGGKGGWSRILAGLGLCTAAGLLVKESAVLLPLYALCIELCLLRFRGPSNIADRRIYWLFALVLVLPAVVGLAWLAPRALNPAAFANRNFDLAERLLTESRVLLDYLHWTVLPNLNQLSLYHDDYQVSHGWLDPPTTALAIVLLATALITGWLLRSRRPLLSLGCLWFFSAHLLTATVIPLELMFEHRNYFASIGVLLVLADLLILGPQGKNPRRLGAALAVFLVAFYAGGTYLRASEWNHPVRFVSTEVAKHPQSPRATYELARMLVVLSDYKKDSPYLKPAMAAIEAARSVPDANVLPAQAALIVAARTGQPMQAAWWADLEQKLEQQPVGPQPLGALAMMVDCSNSRKCAFPPNDMLRAFSAALSHGDDPELLNIYSSYALMSLGDVELALKLAREAIRLRPAEPQYRINLARLLIALGRDTEARKEILELRQLGALGQNERAADLLDADLRGE